MPSDQQRRRELARAMIHYAPLYATHGFRLTLSARPFAIDILREGRQVAEVRGSYGAGLRLFLTAWLFARPGLPIPTIEGDTDDFN